MDWNPMHWSNRAKIIGASIAAVFGLYLWTRKQAPPATATNVSPVLPNTSGLTDPYNVGAGLFYQGGGSWAPSPPAGNNNGSPPPGAGDTTPEWLKNPPAWYTAAPNVTPPSMPGWLANAPDWLTNPPAWFTSGPHQDPSSLPVALPNNPPLYPNNPPQPPAYVSSPSYLSGGGATGVSVGPYVPSTPMNTPPMPPSYINGGGNQPVRVGPVQTDAFGNAITPSTGAGLPSFHTDPFPSGGGPYFSGNPADNNAMLLALQNAMHLNNPFGPPQEHYG